MTCNSSPWEKEGIRRWWYVKYFVKIIMNIQFCPSVITRLSVSEGRQTRMFSNSNRTLASLVFSLIVGFRYQCVPWNVMNFEYVNSLGLARTTAQQCSLYREDGSYEEWMAFLYQLDHLQHPLCKTYNIHSDVMIEISTSQNIHQTPRPAKLSMPVRSGLSKIKRWNLELTNPLGTGRNCPVLLEK